MAKKLCYAMWFNSKQLLEVSSYEEKQLRIIIYDGKVSTVSFET